MTEQLLRDHERAWLWRDTGAALNYSVLRAVTSPPLSIISASRANSMRSSLGGASDQCSPPARRWASLGNSLCTPCIYQFQARVRLAPSAVPASSRSVRRARDETSSIRLRVADGGWCRHGELNIKGPAAANAPPSRRTSSLRSQWCSIIALGVGDAVLPDCAQWSEDDQHGHSDVGCQEQTKGSKDQSLVHGRTPLFSSHLALPGFNMPPVQLA
jgi:hypothetical protein